MEVTQEMRDKLSAMRARMTAGYIGEAECGCVLAMIIFDPNNKREEKEAMKEAGSWLRNGLTPKRCSDIETRRITASCPHKKKQAAQDAVICEPATNPMGI